MTNSDALREVLDAEVAKQPRTMIIDLSGLRFMDSSALHVVLRANRVMDRQGGVLALASPREPVAKMLRLTAADQLIPVYPERARGHRGIAGPKKIRQAPVYRGSGWDMISTSGAYDAGTFHAIIGVRARAAHYSFRLRRPPDGTP